MITTLDPNAIRTTRADLVAAYLANPQDDAVRSALADFLLENREDFLAECLQNRALTLHIGSFVTDEMLRDRIDELLDFINTECNRYMREDSAACWGRELTEKDEEFFAHHIPKFTAEYLGKWCRIVRTDSGRSVWGFIALESFHTKELGNVRKGAMHKAAGWKKPAKHERGHLFATAKFGDGFTWRGPNYLR